MKVCVGGTFDKLHKGHKTLIKKAFDVARQDGFVFIGLTKGEIIKNKKDVESFNERKKIIEKYILDYGFFSRFEVKPIKDKFGPSINGDFDAIIISPETKKTAIEINEARKKKNKKILKIIEIPFVLAEDKKPISSTKIKNKEIDGEGNIL